MLKWFVCVDWFFDFGGVFIKNVKVWVVCVLEIDYWNFFFVGDGLFYFGYEVCEVMINKWIVLCCYIIVGF